MSGSEWEWECKRGELNDCWIEQRERGKLGRGNGHWALDIGHTDIRTELTSWRWQRGTDEHRIVTTATNGAQAISLPFYCRQTTGECDSVLSLRFSFSFSLLCPCVVWTNGCITSQVRYDWTDINCVVIFFSQFKQERTIHSPILVLASVGLGIFGLWCCRGLQSKYWMDVKLLFCFCLVLFTSRHPIQMDAHFLLSNMKEYSLLVVICPRPVCCYCSFNVCACNCSLCCLCKDVGAWKDKMWEKKYRYL